MKKLRQHIAPLLLLAALALLQSACQQDDAPTVGRGFAASTTTITLDAQVQQMLTRAGAEGMMTDKKLTETGFGVFAFGLGDGWSNRKIDYRGTPLTESDLGDVHLHPEWNYDTGVDWADGQKLSFLAYAPYVEAGVPNQPGNQPGITGITSSSVDATTIAYQVAEKPSEAVDLLWGVRASTGLPWLGVTGSECGGLVLFTFQHALAGLSYRVQAMIDKDNDLSDLTDVSDPNSLLGSEVKVLLKRITLQPATGTNPGTIYASGTLNLINSKKDTPHWENDGSTPLSSLTLDGDDGEIIDDLTSGSGVLSTPGQPVIKNDNYFMLIPNTEKKNYQVEVEYEVVVSTVGSGSAASTAAGNRPAVVTLQNWQFLPGVKYYLNLVIGLKTLTLTVDATDWAGNTISKEVLTERGTSASSSLARKNRP